MAGRREFVPSVPREVIKAIRGIRKPTVEQQLIIDELTQTLTPELGPMLAKELAATTQKKKPSLKKRGG